jgi:hypothetical protein
MYIITHKTYMKYVANSFVTNVQILSCLGILAHMSVSLGIRKLQVLNFDIQNLVNIFLNQTLF